MLENARKRMREKFNLARLRETRFLMSFEVASLNIKLAVLLLVFVGLSFLDVLSTLVAINTGPAFVELNPIASGLFGRDFPGFIAALTLKYIPLVPLGYATFAKDTGQRPLAIRVVKVSTLVALAAADVFYLVVVGSNFRTLVGYFF